jgi:hypothetical protein
VTERQFFGVHRVTADSPPIGWREALPDLPPTELAGDGGDAATGDSTACALDTPDVNSGGIGEASLPALLEATRLAMVRATQPEDPDELAAVLYEVQELRSTLAEIDREWSHWLGQWSLEQWGKQKWGEVGGRVVERQWRSGRTTWDHSEVTDALLDYLDAGPQERSTVREVLNAAGVSYWRAGVLKERGIQPADFKAQDPGRWAINFPESS